MITLSKRIVDVETLAGYFGCTERNIQLWVSEHGAPNWQNDKSLDRGEYNLDEFIKWRVKYLEGQIELEKAGGQRKYELEARQIELRNIDLSQKIEIRGKNFIPKDIVNIAWQSEVIAFRGALDALENNLILALKGHHDDDKITAAIKSKIREIKEQLGTELRINNDDDYEITESINEPEDNSNNE